jgi:hypothetical protein
MDERNDTRLEAAAPTLHEISSNSIRYWEPRRIVYNLVLGLIVVGYMAAYWPESRDVVTLDGVLAMFILAVLANVCYCAAYLVDVFAQYSDLRQLWLRWRWVLFAAGMLLAAILTRFFALGFSTSGGVD